MRLIVDADVTVGALGVTVHQPTEAIATDPHDCATASRCALRTATAWQRRGTLGRPSYRSIRGS